MNAEPQSPPRHRLMYWLLLALAPMALYLSGAIVALLLALAAIGVCQAQNRQALLTAAAGRSGGWLLGALLFYALLSAAWARDPLEAAYDGWRIVLIVGSGWLLLRFIAQLESGQCRYLLRGVLWGTALLLLLLLLEWLSGGLPASWVKQHPTANLLFTSRACAVLAVLMWPVALYCRERLGPGAAAVLLVMSVVLIGALPLLAAGVALVFAALVFAAQYAWPRATPRLLGALVIAAVLAAPWAALQIHRLGNAPDTLQAVEKLPSSWRHRLVIWEFFAKRIQRSPWFGHGLGTSHGLGEVAPAARDYRRIARVLGNPMIARSPPLHPHNAALQLWHDLGLTGVLGVGAWLWLIVTGLARRGFSRQGMAATMAALTAWLVIAGLSFGLWQKWWLAAGAVAAAINMLLLQGMESQGDPGNA